METTITTRPTACGDCLADHEHCHGVSIEHADGSTLCLGEGICEVAHHLHEWQLPCSVLDPPCPCVPEDGFSPLLAA